MPTISTFQTVLRAFGWRGLVRRVAYVAVLRSGIVQRQAPLALDLQDSDPLTWSFRFDLDRLRAAYDLLDHRTDRIRAETVAADLILDSQLTLYGWATKQVSWPPRWHVNPFTGHEYPQVHWTQLSDNDPAAGDIKDVWELSRLPFTTTFARAYVLTVDDR